MNNSKTHRESVHLCVYDADITILQLND